MLNNFLFLFENLYSFVHIKTLILKYASFLIIKFVIQIFIFIIHFKFLNLLFFVHKLRFPFLFIIQIFIFQTYIFLCLFLIIIILLHLSFLDFRMFFIYNFFILYFIFFIHVIKQYSKCAGTYLVRFQFLFKLFHHLIINFNC